MNAASPPSDLDRSRTRVLVLSTLAFTLLFAVWLMLGVLAVAIRDELELNAVQFSWLTASAILTGSLLRLPFGVLTDRLGGRTMMTASLLIAAVPCYAMSQVETFGQALGCALGYGLAGNAFSVGVAWNAAWFPQERQGFALGTFGAGNVGASITKLLGPALMSIVPAGGLLGGFIPSGWRSVPVLYAVLLLAMAAWVWFGSPKPERTPGIDASGDVQSVASMMGPLRDVRVWRFGVYYVLVFGAYVALSLWLPRLYVTTFGLSLTKAALLTAFFVFPASLLRPLGGYLADRFGSRNVTYAVFLSMIASCVVLSLPTRQLGVTGFFVCTLWLGAGMGIGKASVYKYIPQYYPGHVGLVGGLVGTLGALGGFLLPLAFGYLEQATGRVEVCFQVLAVLAIGSLVWLHAVVSAHRSRPGAVGMPLATR
jgi:NNP family nitrate/nitrite transporter-like MFS transporter